MEKQCFCIVGPGRSGTSLLTRLLNIIGLELGSDKTLGNNRDFNEIGTWENSFFKQINIEVLRRLGTSGNVPPELGYQDSWGNASCFEDLRCKAKIFLEKEFGNSEIWGWKEPMTVLVLPFWKSIIPNMKFILCLRNPLSIINSHMKTSGYSIYRSAIRCYYYTASAIYHSQGHDRTVFFFEDLMEDLERQCKRMVEFLGLSSDNKESDLLTQMHKTIRGDLVHHKIPFFEFLTHPNIPSGIKTLYFGAYSHVAMMNAKIDGVKVSAADFAGMLDASLRFSIEQWQTESPLFIKMWRNVAKHFPINQRGNIFYITNHILEVLGQGGPKEMIKGLKRNLSLNKIDERLRGRCSD